MANVVWRPKYLFATFATCRVVSRHVARVSRHFFTFATFAREDILFRQPCRHDICATSRHDIFRHDIHVATCRDMSRHFATCRDITRHWLTFVVKMYLYTCFFLYGCKKLYTSPRVLFQFSHVLAGHIQWSGGSNPSSANTTFTWLYTHQVESFFVHAK